MNVNYVLAMAIYAIQTSLNLMGNMSHPTSASRRNILLMQLNPQLKFLFIYADFKEAPPLLLAESFGALAKVQLYAAPALKKTTFTGLGATQGFQRSHPLEISRLPGGSQSSGYREKTRDKNQLVTKPPRAKRNDQI